MDQFRIGTNIVYGDEASAYLEAYNKKKVFIVTDKTMVDLGILERLKPMIDANESNIHLFTEVEPDPSLQTVKKGLQSYQQVKPDVLIGLGGGSPIDVSKAILYFSIEIQKQFVRDESIYKPTFVAIPTTSGTGSEVTSYSVITDDDNGVKIPLTSDDMIPDVALLDERLTMTVPPKITADTGMDVLTHALEALVSKNATPFTDIFAEKAIKFVSRHLSTAYQHGEDIEARRAMHLASCMAGIAFNYASLGINHSLAHSIGARFHIAHGRSNAILLPYVIAYNAGLYDRSVNDSGTAKKYSLAAKWMGRDVQSIESGVLHLIDEIQKLNMEFSIPLSLHDYGLEQADFNEQISDTAMNAMKDACTTGNPKNVSKQEMASILSKVFIGKMM